MGSPLQRTPDEPEPFAPLRRRHHARRRRSGAAPRSASPRAQNFARKPRAPPSPRRNACRARPARRRRSARRGSPKHGAARKDDGALHACLLRRREKREAAADIRPKIAGEVVALPAAIAARQDDRAPRGRACPRHRRAPPLRQGEERSPSIHSMPSGSPRRSEDGRRHARTLIPASISRFDDEPADIACRAGHGDRHAIRSLARLGGTTGRCSGGASPSNMRHQRSISG